jgi:hypothetical protein
VVATLSDEIGRRVALATPGAVDERIVDGRGELGRSVAYETAVDSIGRSS